MRSRDGNCIYLNLTFTHRLNHVFTASRRLGGRHPMSELRLIAPRACREAKTVGKIIYKPHVYILKRMIRTDKSRAMAHAGLRIVDLDDPSLHELPRVLSLLQPQLIISNNCRCPSLSLCGAPGVSLRRRGSEHEGLHVPVSASQRGYRRFSGECSTCDTYYSGPQQ